MKILFILILFVGCSFNYQPLRTGSVNDRTLSQVQTIKVSDIEYANTGRNLVTRDAFLKEKIKNNLQNYLPDHQILSSEAFSCGKGVARLTTQISSFKSEPANSELVIYMNLFDCLGTPLWHGSYVVREKDHINNIAGGTSLQNSNIEILLNSAISSLAKGLKADFQHSILK